MHSKKVYIEELESVGKRQVWLVDGEHVRKDLNENFVEYDEHYHLHFIPKNELWIDKDSDPRERHFFIDHMINEEWLVESGKTYEEAMKVADAIEKKERAKILHIESGEKKESKKEILEKIRESLWKDFGGNLKIYKVDGRAVRDYLFVEYADGGHDRVYSFIPKGEIWIEEILPEEEAKFILLHELHERFLMCNGKDYLHAHKGATEVEDYYRDHPKEIVDRIKEEMDKNI